MYIYHKILRMAVQKYKSLRSDWNLTEKFMHKNKIKWNCSEIQSKRSTYMRDGKLCKRKIISLKVSVFIGYKKTFSLSTQCFFFEIYEIYESKKMNFLSNLEVYNKYSDGENVKHSYFPFAKCVYRKVIMLLYIQTHINVFSEYFDAHHTYICFWLLTRVRSIIVLVSYLWKLGRSFPVSIINAFKSI